MYGQEMDGDLDMLFGEGAPATAGAVTGSGLNDWA